MMEFPCKKRIRSSKHMRINRKRKRRKNSKVKKLTLMYLKRQKLNNKNS